MIRLASLRRPRSESAWALLFGAALAVLSAGTGAARAGEATKEVSFGPALDRFRMAEGEAREAARKEILDRKPDAVALAKAVREQTTFSGGFPKGAQQVTVAGAERPMELYVPQNYDPKKKTPVLVGLHGTGGKGDQVRDPGAPVCEKKGWLLICPTLPDSDIQSAMKKGGTTGFGWGDHRENLGLKALAWVFRNFRCDSDRAYLMGVSQGGYGAWGVGACYSFRWAAILPYAGGIDFRENFGAAMGMLDKMPANGQIPPGAVPPQLQGLLNSGLTQLAGGGRRRDLLKNTMNAPVFFVHGAKDNIVEPAGDRKSNEELNAIGYKNHKYLEKPDWGHVPRDPKEVEGLVTDMVDWAAKHARATFPKKLFHFSPRLDTGETYYLRLDRFNEGAEVSATRNGNTIAITTKQVKEMTVFLGDGVVDLTKMVAITVNGKEVFSGKAPVSAATVLETYENGWDPARTFSGAVKVTLE